LLVASFAIGALAGSIAISVASRLIRPARMMLVFAMVWYAMLLAFVSQFTGGGFLLGLLLGIIGGILAIFFEADTDTAVDLGDL